MNRTADEVKSPALDSICGYPCGSRYNSAINSSTNSSTVVGRLLCLSIFFPVSGLNVLIAIGWHVASGYPPMLRLRNIAEGVKRNVNGTSYLENGVMDNLEING